MSYKKDVSVDDDGLQRQNMFDLYRSVAPNAFEFIFRTNSRDQIIFSNALFARHFGFNAHKSVDGFDAMRIFIHESEFQRIREETLSKRRTHIQKVGMKTRAGRCLSVMINTSVSFGANDEWAINWNVVDISETVAFEEDLKAKHEELQKVNSMMEKFLYSTSHDLRSPVSSILGLINLMRIEHVPEELQEYISKIEISATRLDMIIHDLMGFSKTSYQRTRLVQIDLPGLIHRVVNSFSSAPTFQQTSFQFEINATIPFISDEERVSLILENIVRNAIQFFDITKACPFIRITAAVSPELVTIQVFDNGIGIPKQHQSRIFNMFYKASDLSQGAGLGLYIVKESLLQLNGSVTVESEPGFGSLFRLAIPNRSTANE